MSQLTVLMTLNTLFLATENAGMPRLERSDHLNHALTSMRVQWKQIDRTKLLIQSAPLATVLSLNASGLPLPAAAQVTTQYQLMKRARLRLRLRLLVEVDRPPERPFVYDQNLRAVGRESKYDEGFIPLPDPSMQIGPSFVPCPTSNSHPQMNQQPNLCSIRRS